MNLKLKIRAACLLTLMAVTFGSVFAQTANSPYFLIAHRGGVVDSTTSENSEQAMKKAYHQGFKMIEIDLRLTRDSVLITHHDATFKRSFGLDSAVSSMTWAQISMLENTHGYRVQTLEQVLAYCQGKMDVMIDLKIRGNDPPLFDRILAMLKQYELYDGALMIGTEESTPSFIGKIKQSCTRKQLEQYMQLPGYNSRNYYFFSGNISREDFEWAREHHILTIGVVNAWAIRNSEVMEKAASQANALKEAGVTSFQIDSWFLPFFR